MQFGFFYVVIIVSFTTICCARRRDVACNVSTGECRNKRCLRRDVACNVSTLWGIPEKCCLRTDVACNVSTGGLLDTTICCPRRRDVACNVSTHRNAGNDINQSEKITTTFTQPLPPYTNLHHTSRSTLPAILEQVQAWVGNYQTPVSRRRGAWAQ